MGKYQGVDCPICDKPLENGEDIVICDVCGAPYHRKCVAKEKRCIYMDLHRLGESWQHPDTVKEAENAFAGDEKKRCSRCGTVNPINGLFCEVCGNTLNSSDAQENNFENYIRNDTYQRYSHKPTMEYNPYTTPFGGVDPDDIIDEVSVKDLTIFVGHNTPYFIPKFKQFSESPKSASFNFAAFIFTGIYFLYRKMYGLGALFLAVMIITAIPSYIVQLDNIQKSMEISLFDINISDSLYTLNIIFSLVNLVSMFIAGAFGNKFYKSHCVSKIKNIKNNFTEHEEYNEQLIKQGSVSKTIIFVLIGVYFILQFLFVFFAFNNAL